MRIAAAETHVGITARYDARNPSALQTLLGEGIELVRFPDEILTAARATAFDLYEELASTNASYRKIYSSWQQFRAVSNRWLATFELGFTNFAFRSSF